MTRLPILFAALALLSGCATSGAPMASTSGSHDTFARASTNEVVVRNDSGGYVVAYAMRVQRIKQDGKRVRFAGRCDSACTMYLGLPRDQVCIERGAYFRFHRPTARSSATVAAATEFLNSNYPAWVRKWIAANGGLTSSLKTMNYQYASKYVQPCTASA